jgi:hypothetical protein
MVKGRGCFPQNKKGMLSWHGLFLLQTGENPCFTVENFRESAENSSRQDW